MKNSKVEKFLRVQQKLENTQFLKDYINLQKSYFGHRVHFDNENGKIYYTEYPYSWLEFACILRQFTLKKDKIRPTKDILNELRDKNHSRLSEFKALSGAWDNWLEDINLPVQIFIDNNSIPENWIYGNPRDDLKKKYIHIRNIVFYGHLFHTDEEKEKQYVLYQSHPYYMALLIWDLMNLFLMSRKMAALLKS